MTTAETTETAPPSDEAAAPPPPRRRLLPWIAGGAALALLAGGIPLGVWIGGEIAVTNAAKEDAALLTTALTGATDAVDDFRATATAVAQYAGDIAVPVRDAVAGSPGDFDQASADALAASVAAVLATAVPPLEREQTDGETAEDEQADADQTEDAPADPTAEALGIRLEHLSDDPERFAAELERHYRALPGEDREAARAAVVREAERLDELAALHRAAEADARAAVDAADAAIVAAAGVGQATGAARLASFSYAGDDARATMQASVDGLAALAAAELPIAWEGRLADEAAPLAVAPATVSGYLAATAEARASESANAPAPVRQGWSCFKWSPWGSYLGWCY